MRGLIHEIMVFIFLMGLFIGQIICLMSKRLCAVCTIMASLFYASWASDTRFWTYMVSNGFWLHVLYCNYTFFSSKILTEYVAFGGEEPEVYLQ